MKAIDDESLVSALRKWKNGRVKFWSYSPSHSRLTLRVESREQPGNLHITCGGCLNVHGPIKWNNCDLEIHSITTDDEGKVKVLRDKSSGFEVQCAVVSAKENVEPVYVPNLGNCETSSAPS